MLGMIHIANRWSLSLLSNSSRIFLFNDPKQRKCKFSWETNNNYVWITYGRSRDMRLCWFLKPTITKNKKPPPISSTFLRNKQFPQFLTPQTPMAAATFNPKTQTYTSARPPIHVPTNPNHQSLPPLFSSIIQQIEKGAKTLTKQMFVNQKEIRFNYGKQ